jgi:hypothetical protein
MDAAHDDIAALRSALEQAQARAAAAEAEAARVTWLAFPGESESDEVRSRVHASLCAYALRVKYETDPEWLVSAQPIKPVYALRPQCEIDRDLRTFQRRLRDRMIAGRMAIGFLKEAVTGEIPELPAGIKRMSVNQMAQLVLADASYTDPENVEARIWRRSLPVIHLANAIQVMLQIAEPGLESLLLDRGIIELVVRTAQYHESVIAQSQHLKVDPETLIRIRLAHSG